MEALLALAKAVKESQECLNPDLQDCCADAAGSFEEGLRYLSQSSDYAGTIAAELAEGGHDLEATFRQVGDALDAL